MPVCIHQEPLYARRVKLDPNAALNVTMCSYADRVTFGYVSGRHVMPDIGRLIPLTERVLVDLETALGVAT